MYCTRDSSCMTLAWLHHHHKVSASYQKNGLFPSHRIIPNPLADGIFLKNCLFVRIFCRNVAITSHLVAVSRWNSRLEPFRFHVNYFLIRAPVFVHVGQAQLSTENAFRFKCVVLWRLHGYQRMFDMAVQVCGCV